MTIGEMVVDGLKRLVAAGIVVLPLFFALAAVVAWCSGWGGWRVWLLAEGGNGVPAAAAR